MHAGVGSAPFEWIELRLIELYHCTPDVLDEQDAQRSLLYLRMKDLASEIQELHRDN